MWIIFFSVPIVVHIVAQRSAVGLKFDFLKENENKPWGGVKYSVQVAILPHILPWSPFLGPRCYYWCCCVCSQRPSGLGPQFCLETRSIMVRLFPGRGGGGFWTPVRKPLVASQSAWFLLATRALHLPALYSHRTCCCVVFISWDWSINEAKSAECKLTSQNFQ